MPDPSSPPTLPAITIPQPINPRALDIAAQAQSVHTTMDGALAALSPGATGAFILHGTYDLGGKPAIQAITVIKGPAGWDAYVGAQWSGGDHAQAQFGVMKEW